jgi:hypothetical protein
MAQSLYSKLRPNSRYNLPEVLSTDFIALPTSTGIAGDDGVE